MGSTYKIIELVGTSADSWEEAAKTAVETAGKSLEDLRVAEITRMDVTAFILTQIVLEKAKNKSALLPVPLLHLIIQYGENILEEFFEKYLEQTIKNYISYKAAFDEQFEKWLNLGTNLSQAGKKTMAGMTPFQAFFQQFSDSEETKEKDGHEK